MEPKAERLAWIERAIEHSRTWAERERVESEGERTVARPGSWDYDYNTDIVRICKQAEATISALEAERDLILRCREHLQRDTEDGKYADD